MSIDSSKAQSLSVNTLVIAALSIFVLVVGILIYNGVVQDSDSTIRSCENQGGTCYALQTCPAGTGPNNLGECSDGRICCTG